MQLGTAVAPLAAAGAVLWFRRDRLLAGATALVGVGTWFAAKGVKRIVERGRPLSYLPDINVRDGDGTGLGYVSGHSAVAAATATMVVGVVPRRYRPVLVVPVGLVGVARVVFGVHLPADVVGGWSFGVLVGLAGTQALGPARRALGRRDAT